MVRESRYFTRASHTYWHREQPAAMPTRLLQSCFARMASDNKHTASYSVKVDRWIARTCTTRTQLNPSRRPREISITLKSRDARHMIRLFQGSN